MIKHYNQHKERIKRQQSQPNSNKPGESTHFKQLFEESSKGSKRSGDIKFKNTEVNILINVTCMFFLNRNL